MLTELISEDKNDYDIILGLNIIPFRHKLIMVFKGLNSNDKEKKQDSYLED